jgi:hypothetical protein
MTERSDLESFRDWIIKHGVRSAGLNGEAALEIVESALSLEQKLERLTKRLEEIKADATHRKNAATQTGVEWAEEAAINQLYVVDELLKELQS